MLKTLHVKQLDPVEYAVCFRGTKHRKIQTNIKCCLARAWLLPHQL